MRIPRSHGVSKEVLEIRRAKSARKVIEVEPVQEPDDVKESFMTWLNGGLSAPAPTTDGAVSQPRARSRADRYPSANEAIPGAAVEVITLRHTVTNAMLEQADDGQRYSIDRFVESMWPARRGLIERRIEAKADSSGWDIIDIYPRNPSATPAPATVLPSQTIIPDRSQPDTVRAVITWEAVEEYAGRNNMPRNSRSDAENIIARMFPRASDVLRRVTEFDTIRQEYHVIDTLMSSQSPMWVSENRVGHDIVVQHLRNIGAQHGVTLSQHQQYEAIDALLPPAPGLHSRHITEGVAVSRDSRYYIVRDTYYERPEVEPVPRWPAQQTATQVTESARAVPQQLLESARQFLMNSSDILTARQRMEITVSNDLTDSMDAMTDAMRYAMARGLGNVSGTAVVNTPPNPDNIPRSDDGQDHDCPF